jgi:hypothetical protein
LYFRKSYRHSVETKNLNIQKWFVYWYSKYTRIYSESLVFVGYWKFFQAKLVWYFNVKPGDIFGIETRLISIFSTFKYLYFDNSSSSTSLWSSTSKEINNFYSESSHWVNDIFHTTLPAQNSLKFKRISYPADSFLNQDCVQIKSSPEHLFCLIQNI